MPQTPERCEFVRNWKLNVERDEDILVHTYDWYSAHIYLSGVREKVSVVRFGPWNRGHEATTDDLALALYYDGKLLRSYSTLEIAGRKENVRTSVSHYVWHGKVVGYRYHTSPSVNHLIYGFSIETLDGRNLCFDVQTGELVKDAKPEF